jgi:integrase
MPLTDIQIKSAKPAQATSKLFDGGGLFLEVTPQGSKRWRLKYRFGGVEKLISLGIYPEVKLRDARDRRDDARKLLANGVDPSENRKAQKLALSNVNTNSFEVIGREWIAKQTSTWTPGHTKTVTLRLQLNVFPYIGMMPIESIAPPDLLKVLRKIEDREAIETAHRVRGLFGQIFRYAIATGRVTSDPSRDLRGALSPVKKQHLAAVTEPRLAADLLKMIDGHRGSPIVKAALSLAPLVFVRPGELRQAEWKDIDFENAEWRFIVSKTDTQHIVPLATQSIEILQGIHLITGSGRYVFPSARTFERPMSNNAILAALRSIGIPKEQMCGHGFRAMARTILDEVLKFPPHLIEHQLAHAVKDALGRAYNRTKHLPERKNMMQQWADYLDDLKRGES